VATGWVLVVGATIKGEVPGGDAIPVRLVVSGGAAG